MTWLETSYMARKGVAKGKAGKAHQLTEAAQGRYHYVYGAYAEPVMRIKPGDLVIAETQDAFEGAITSESDKPSEKLNVPFLNPQCGPIAVEGAEKGDVLCVHIHSIKPRGPQPVGTTALITEFGGLVATTATALLNQPLPERVKKMEVTEQGIKFNEKITLPYEPFIGTLGVAPEIEAVSSLQPDYWGGNMDVPDVAPGAILYFPVLHKDAYLFLGDCHGTQGDGELCGVAVEIPATVTIHVDLIKGWQIAWPRLENERFIMTLGSARPMEDAARIAYRELIRWLVSDFGFEESEAYFLLTQAGRVRLGNMVDPKYTLGASILKSYLSLREGLAMAEDRKGRHEAVVRVACVQMEPHVGDKAANVAKGVALIEEAAANGARLVVLPELCNSGYVFESRDEAFALAEPVPDGQTVQTWARLARDHGLYISAGICERDGDLLYNSAAFIGPEGPIGTFRKVHLWNEENLFFEPGNLGFPVWGTPIGRVGALICYDGWFPEGYRLCALQGADIICISTNWVPIPGQDPNREAMANILCMSAAHTNSVFIAAADRVGTERGQPFIGQSLVVSYTGWPVAGPASRTEEEIIYADCNLADARRKRNWNEYNQVLRDRRTDVYDEMLGTGAKPGWY